MAGLADFKVGYLTMTKHNYHKCEYVWLTFSEHKKLLEKFGLEATKDKIECLNDYIASRGLQKKYKSHYHTILVWNRKEEKAKAKPVPVFNQPNGYYKAKSEPTGKTIGMKEAFSRLKDEMEDRKGGE